MRSVRSGEADRSLCVRIVILPLTAARGLTLGMNLNVPPRSDRWAARQADDGTRDLFAAHLPGPG